MTKSQRIGSVCSRKSPSLLAAKRRRSTGAHARALGLERQPGKPFLERNRSGGRSSMAGELYFSDASEHPVKRVSVSGGTPTPLAYRGGAPVRLVVSGGTVFWSDGGRLFRTSIETRETTLLASGNLETSPTLLAEGDAVYWVRTVSSGDCSPACIHRIERIAGGTTSVVAEARQEISGFIQDTAWVYWAERGFGPASATCNCGSGVKKAPKAGGPATLLVDGTLNGLFPPPPPPFIQAGWSPSANVALSGGSVIFSDGVRILSIPLAGGSVSIVATLVTPRP